MAKVIRFAPIAVGVRVVLGVAVTTQRAALATLRRGRPLNRGAT